MALTDYRTLGRSGLVVSLLGLGTITFGTARWGSNEEGSRAVFDAYLEAGGNFIDTRSPACGNRPMFQARQHTRAIRSRYPKSATNSTCGSM